MTSSTVGKDGRAALVTKQSSDVAEGVGTELLPCPFCGNAEVRIETGLSNFEDACIYCEPCGLYGPTFDNDQHTTTSISGNPTLEAVNHWNTRTAAQPGDTPSADGTASLFTPSLNTSSLPQIPSIDARVKELETALARIRNLAGWSTLSYAREIARSAISQRTAP